MKNTIVPYHEWHKFLRNFSRRHAGWPVTIETHDTQTGEKVASRSVRFERAELDLEDILNTRINVWVRDGNTEIKHILFRPTDLRQEVSESKDEEALRIVAIHTITTVKFRPAEQKTGDKAA